MVAKNFKIIIFAVASCVFMLPCNSSPVQDQDDKMSHDSMPVASISFSSRSSYWKAFLQSWLPVNRFATLKLDDIDISKDGKFYIQAAAQGMQAARVETTIFQPILLQGCTFQDGIKIAAALADYAYMELAIVNSSFWKSYVSNQQICQQIHEIFAWARQGWRPMIIVIDADCVCGFDARLNCYEEQWVKALLSEMDCSLDTCMILFISEDSQSLHPAVLSRIATKISM
jgi:hypothetical protein